ncbi:MAG: DUF885 domain-containing protein [Candidatus Eisenbacteria bacterium]|nr:DUF885 domain-containing protein [Candidatus Eisenbacteria bacterium]
MLETVKAFSALSEEFVECSMRHDPVAATAAGIHDYDHLYPDDTPEGFGERAAWLRDLEQRLVASVPWEELPPEHRVDYALLRSRVASQRADLEEIRTAARDPVRYPQAALLGVFLLMARPFAPLEERKEAALARLMAVPDYLKAARANLGTVPPLFVEIASEVNATGPGFVEDVTRTLIRSFPGEAERIEHAGGRARMGFLQYQEFLDRDLRPRAGGGIAIGERWMNFKLEREHLLGLDCATLEAFGREHLERTRALLEQEARRLDPQRSWQEQIAEARQRHPEALRVRDAYVAEVERARRFVEEQHLAPLPDARLEILDTPVFERATTPHATYLRPAPFDVDQTGYLFVTPVDLSRRRDEHAQQLQGHAYPALPLIALHETWPGHHLQLGHAVRAGSRLRRLADSPLFAEGWALYCAELMYEQGYFLDPLTRLWQLRDQLWRACRVVIDVGLHTGRMSFEQAVDFLVGEAMIERVNADAEVRRYALTPTEPMSYLVGKTLLLEQRVDARRRLGERFDLYEFHAALLASGTVPPALLAEELWTRLGVA